MILISPTKGIASNMFSPIEEFDLLATTKKIRMKLIKVKIPEFLPWAPQNCNQKLGLVSDAEISIETQNPRLITKIHRTSLDSKRDLRRKAVEPKAKRPSNAILIKLIASIFINGVIAIGISENAIRSHPVS